MAAKAFSGNIARLVGDLEEATLRVGDLGEATLRVGKTTAGGDGARGGATGLSINFS